VAGTQGGPGGLQHPVLWSPRRVVRELPLPAGYAQATVTGLDEDGTVVGFALTEPTDPSPGAPVVWRTDGSVQVLTPPDGGAELNGFPVIGAARILAVNGASELLEWDVRGGAPRVLTDSVQRLSAVNSRGSVLISAFPKGDVLVDGLVRNGELRPIPRFGGISRPNALSDRDTLYLQTNDRGDSVPMKYDCTAS